MLKWIRIIAPLVALTVVLGVGYAALGNGQASARQVSAPVAAPAAQPPPPVPTEAPKGEPDTGAAEQQDGAQTEVPDSETKDGTVDAETKDGANQPDNEAADAAALAGNATVTADQANATVLAANPGATVVKAELDDENGVLVYSVELSTGADVKIDAQKGNIVNTDQAGSDANDGAGDSEASDAPNK
jgi:uncharacterized membrane protein YkoI